MKKILFKYIFFAIAVLYIPALFIVSAFADGDGTFISMPYIFILGVLAIYTLPFYFAFIELGLAVCRALEKKRTTAAEKVLNIIGIVLALSTVLITVIAYIAFELSEMVYLLFVVTVLLALKWIVTAIICKKKPDFEILKQKIFWIIVVLMAVVIAIIAVISTVLTENRNRPENSFENAYGFEFRECGSEYDGIYFDFDDKRNENGLDIISKTPSLSVTWVNTTDSDVEYDMKYYVYKQTSDGWGLCSTDYIDFPDVVYTLAAQSTAVHSYTFDGYDISEDGIYKFVAFIDGKAIWVEFEIAMLETTIEY